MGDEADALMDLALDAELEEEMYEDPDKEKEARRKYKARIWTTKDGKEIPIKNMNIGHLRNTIAMLYNNGYVSRETLEFYLLCAPPNGEMAQYYFEREQDEVLRRTVNPWIDLLQDELRSREVQHIAPGLNKIKRRKR